MLFQLRNLSDREYKLVMDAPILVGILIGSADGVLSEKEVNRLRELIQTKVYSEKNDVHLLYKKLAEDELSDNITSLAAQTAEFPTIELKEKFMIEQLQGLNKIWPKMNRGYAVQYHKSIRDIAIAVANSSGGILGMGRISFEEGELIDLKFITKP